MPDHGRPITFGYFLVPNADTPLMATAVEAEARGLDYIAIQDHPYQRRYVDAFSLLGMIAGRTSRIGLFPDVANLPLRPPAVLAKTAASLDVLSGGRFELGLGAGGFWDAIEAYGGPRRAPAEALAALDEGIQVIWKVWSGERNLRFNGRHYELKGAQSGPVPEHPIGIWLGVYGPKAIALAGRVADGWVPSLRGDAGDTTRLRDMTARLDAAAAAAGRAPGDIRRVVNVNGAVTDGESTGVLRGPVRQWVDELLPLALDLGFDTFVFWGDGPGQLARFAEEVVPAARDAIEAARR
jgi:alkanesulfonate monooxygenase SsuD/methylene tetrahydromethanopterin reductase-like flavin-dependent oxidoreductase (luciferase family)